MYNFELERNASRIVALSTLIEDNVHKLAGFGEESDPEFIDEVAADLEQEIERMMTRLNNLKEQLERK